MSGDSVASGANVGWVVDPPTVTVCVGCAPTEDDARRVAGADAGARVEPVYDRGLELVHGLTCVACGAVVLPGSRAQVG